MSTSPWKVENAATRSPEGDATGDVSWLPWGRVRNGRPKSLGSPVATSSGRYRLRSQRRNSRSKSSGSMRKARSIARPTREPIVFRNSNRKSITPSAPQRSSMKSKAAWP